jgi:hypothetical protein
MVFGIQTPIGVLGLERYGTWNTGQNSLGWQRVGIGMCGRKGSVGPAPPNEEATDCSMWWGYRNILNHHLVRTQVS